MKRLQKGAATALALAVVAFVTAAPIGAETLFVATLDQSQNVPPTGSPGTGTAALILNDAQTEVQYYITYTDLEGTETDAHFHQAPPGENGSILYGLPLGTPKVGNWPVTAHDVGFLFAGEVYVNIHTDLYISGEIRGNISEASTGAAMTPLPATWAAIKAMYE